MIPTPIQIARLCLLAYAPLPDETALGKMGLSLIDVIYSRTIDGKRPFGFVAADQDSRKHAAIPGTRSFSDGLRDCEFFMMSIPFLSGPRAEDGFFSFYLPLRLGNGGRPISILGPGDSFYGHSLGGAIATYLAAEAGSKNLFTVASPRPGDGELAALFSGSSGLRIYNPDDDVPRVPEPIWPLLPFSHVATPTLATASFGRSDKLAAHAIEGYLAGFGGTVS